VFGTLCAISMTGAILCVLGPLLYQSLYSVPDHNQVSLHASSTYRLVLSQLLHLFSVCAGVQGWGVVRSECPVRQRDPEMELYNSWLTFTVIGPPHGMDVTENGNIAR